MARFNITDTPQYNDDFKISFDNNGKMTGSWSYRVQFASVRSTLPTVGSDCPHSNFTDLKVSDLDIQNEGDNVALVTVKYSGNYWGDNGNNTESFPTSKTWDLQVQTTEESITTHFKYKDIPAYRKLQILKLLNGGATLGSDNKLTYDNEADVKESVTLEGAELELAKLIAGDGEEFYLVPRIVYRCMWKDNNPLSNTFLNTVGKIVTPVGDPPDVNENRNWLFVGVSQVWNGIYYDIVAEYWLSGRGRGWDNKIYTDAE